MKKLDEKIFSLLTPHSSFLTKIKFCGLSEPRDIDFANEIMPDYIGFVFYGRSRRYVSFEEAEKLKKILNPAIKTVGVFVDEAPEKILSFSKILDSIQLHGSEDENYIENLQKLTDKAIIKAFKVKDAHDVETALKSPADYVMFDAGQGTGKIFDWNLIKNVTCPYFLAGGLDPENVKDAIKILTPFALDVSSGIESQGFKDKSKMEAFAMAVRNQSI